MIHRLNLSRVTLISVTGIDPKNNLRALQISRTSIDFGDTVLVARTPPKKALEGVRFERLPNNLNYDEFSKFMLYDLYKYVNTEYALFVHHKAYVLRPKSWSDEFLEYDYVGAPWMSRTHFTNRGVEVRVGNGGFSLRSQRLMRAPTILNLDFTDNGTGYFHEDGQLCNYHRHRLELYGIKFAPVDLAAKFATEVEVAETIRSPFGFHNNRSAVPFLFHTKNRMARLIRRFQQRFRSNTDLKIQSHG